MSSIHPALGQDGIEFELQSEGSCERVQVRRFHKFVQVLVFIVRRWGHVQSELLHTIAQTAALALEQRGHQAPQRRPRDHPDAAGEAAGVRRVRARVE